MDVKLRNARLQILHDVHPKGFHAFGFLLFQFVVNEIIREDNAFGRELLAQFGMAISRHRLLGGHSQWQLKLDGQLQIHLQITRIVLKGAHVRVQVRDIHARRQCALYLRAALDQGLVRRSVVVHFRHFAP